MTLQEKISLVEEQLLQGKTLIANALMTAGVTAVEPNPNKPNSYEVFQSYADKIKRLMISNSLILEFDLTKHGRTTKYARTVALPITNIDGKLNTLAIQLVNSDSGNTTQNVANQAIIGGGGANDSDGKRPVWKRRRRW